MLHTPAGSDRHRADVMETTLLFSSTVRRSDRYRPVKKPRRRWVSPCACRPWRAMVAKALEIGAA